MRAARLISLLLLVQSRGRMTAPRLAAELGVSERTVYRDVRALSESGVPIYAEQGGRGGYSLVDGYRTRLTGLTREEAEALFLSGAPAPAQALGLSDALSAARLKVLAALPAELSDVSSRVGARFFVDAPGWFQPVRATPELSAVADAVWADRLLAVRYRRRDKTVRRVLEPYGLVLKQSVWYLAARVDGALRIYRVDRFEEVAETGAGFVRDPEFDLAASWAQRSAEFERQMLAETAVIRLTPAGARGLRHAVGALAAAEALATAESDPDGTLTARLPIESVDIAHRDLLRLGAEVEVLAPAALRDRFAETARMLAKRYGVDAVASGSCA
ncbi:helix-turn-helix transcriptional regulator [Actinocatenispora sera]|uniref:helix-turn-helix transcriptional regulator n=1 Tax=Actinocatenispora sera TaxID=390989 RepID=UPI0004C37E79|nr:WYL domain-containing protein [Actinocatenispora sera]